MAEESRWGVVYSPHSGFGKTHKRWNLIRKYMEQKGVQYDFVQSESSASVSRLVSMLCKNGYHIIVVVGNDATLNDAVNAIMKSKDILPEDFAFAIIPNGIGSDFARFWGISVDDYKLMVDGIFEKNIRRIDVGCCVYHDDGIPQRRYFLNSINIGLGARLIKTTNETEYFIGSRRFSFISAIISQIFERKLFSLTFQVETEHIEGKYMSMCIGNCIGYGQTPNAVPYNGMLDVSVITRPEWWQLFEGFWLLGKGRFLNYKNVHPYRAKQVVVEQLGKAFVSFDGTVLPAKNPEPLKISVESDALRFFTPAYK